MNIKFNNDIVAKLSDVAAKTEIKLRKSSPEIALAAGVIGVVASAVLACKATTEVSDVSYEVNDNLRRIKKTKEDPDCADLYSNEEYKKDLTKAYIYAAKRYTKLYAPSVALGSLSIALILASHGVMSKRNTELVAAYTASQTAFKGYRDAVAAKFGSDVEKEIRYNLKEKEIDEIQYDKNGNETGTKKKKVKDAIDGLDPTLYSPYCFFFDETSTEWERDSEYNKFFLIQQQEIANDLLKHKGYLFLSDVLNMLGIRETKISREVGWIYDENNPIGDNCVDFGIFDVHKERARDFVNGYEKSVLLDFNVDGYIMDKF